MMICPKCGSADIRVSRHPHVMDVFHRMCGQEAYRCRKCRHRFYGAKSAALEMAAAHQSGHSHRWSLWQASSQGRRRLLRQALFLSIFVVAFIIFWCFLRYITTERPPSEDTPPASFLVVRSVE
jgi:hypothetical protein